MNLLRKIFGRQRKEKHIKELNQEIKFFHEQTEIQKRYHAALDGEDGWFERVCIDTFTETIKKERNKNGAIPTSSPIHISG
jgi:hypothetical protein